MKILCTGDRNWRNIAVIRTAFSSVTEKHPTIIHGCARGADTFCGEVAYEFEYPVIEYPAQWDKFGKSAGPIRNREMLKESPDIVFAFHNNIKESKGTKDMISASLKKGIRVILFTETDVKEIGEI